MWLELVFVHAGFEAERIMKAKTEEEVRRCDALSITLS
jgi:hypothetical protein